MVRPRHPPAVKGDAFWRTAALHEYGEVLVAIAVVTVVGWFIPIGYEAFGHVYILVVIALSLRVGRGPVLAAAILSAVVWNFVFIPPRLSFSVLEFEDSVILGTYFVVALIGGQLTARVRAQQRHEQARERRATALFHLTRALAAARTLDDAVEAALRQSSELFGAPTALLLLGETGELAPHGAGTFGMGRESRMLADTAVREGCTTGRWSPAFPAQEGVYVPMRRAEHRLGVFAIGFSPEAPAPTPAQWDLIHGFAGQIALLLERERLRASSEREKLVAESDRLHRTLLDSVSHELKTPLSVLRSAAEKIASSDEQKRGLLVREICTATSRLDHLVANLLNQTRLESGALQVQLDWCDVRDIVAAARRAIGDALAGRICKLEIPDDIPLWRGDAALLEQAVANLLLNAARHTPPGSPISIVAARDRAANRVTLAVSDRGQGIPRDLRDHLFQKFKRANTAHAGGVGLGLSIVRGFMQAQGGDVIADDNPGGGARFSVYLPHAAAGKVPGG
jgi:K+-sensing histidine kinase KdpD